MKVPYHSCMTKILVLPIDIPANSALNGIVYIGSYGVAFLL